MAEFDKMLRNKRQIGITIIILGLVLGILAFILDLAFQGEVNVSQTPVLLLLGGFIISALGAAYIGAGTAGAVTKLQKQMNVMKHTINEKERVIQEQQETLETLSDSRLHGLSETVDKMDFLAKSKVMTELPTKSESQQVVPDIGKIKKEEEPPPEPPKPIEIPKPPSSKWERKEEEGELPPPPKPPTIPGGPPKDLPVPPPKPSDTEEDEIIDEEEEEEEEEEVEDEDEDKEEEEKKEDLPAGDLKEMTCPNCKETIRGEWSECPFCDFEIETTAKEPEEKDEGSEIPPPPTEPEEEKKSPLDNVLDEVLSMKPPEDEEKKEGEPDEGAKEEGQGEGPGEDKGPGEEEPGPEPSEPTETPPSPSSNPAICPNCNKDVKPHWRNCPYCKFNLKS